MGIQDRGYYGDERDGGGGGFRDAMRRMFSSGDIFAWSLPLFRIFGVRVKIHLIYVIYIVAQLLSSLRFDWASFTHIALAMGALFLLVLLHEFGHIFACRWVGGEGDEILMWPLGGLAFCMPPHGWKPSFITTLGGPMVNVILLPILGGALLLATRDWGTVIFDPLAPFKALANIGPTAWSHAALWWLYYINLILLAFNVLLPMFPLDGGRMMQELMWRRMGYRRSLQLAANIGLVLAIAVAILAAVMLSGSRAAMTLFMIAIFAGITCWSERKKAEFLEDESPWAVEFSKGATGRAQKEEERRYREAARRQEQERRQQAEIDRILAKIAASGMNSLSWSEKRTLRKATEEKRKK